MKHVYEERKLTVTAILKEGQPKDDKVVFKFLKDRQEFKSQNGTLEVADGAKKGKFATCDLDLPKVDEDKNNYLLEFSVVTPKEEIPGKEQFTVWPRAGTLKALDVKDDKQFSGFQFKVAQGGNGSDRIYTTKDDGTAIFLLEKGQTFTIEAVDPPFVVKEKKAPKPRQVEVKVEKTFIAEFLAPKPPASGKIKQYVNFSSAKNGQDALGPEVTIKIGAKGDQDGTNNPKIGGPGVFAFVTVKFGPPNKKSKRNNPETKLLGELNVSGLEEKKAREEYKAKVELAGADGVGEFKVNLGLAGGDTCTVEIGGAEGRVDATLEFENWRKVYYELLAPDFMNLPEKALADGSKVKDLPANMTSESDTLSQDSYTEFVVDKTHTFAKDKAPDGTCLPRSFIGRNSGPNTVYILTDHTFTQLPQGVSFDKSKAPRVVPLKLCDDNLFAERSDHDAPRTLSPEVTSRQARINLPRNIYWLPKSGYDGTNTIRRLKWQAKVTFDAHKGKPALDIQFDGTAIDSGSRRKRVYDVEEVNQNKTTRVTFSRLVGDVETGLSNSEKASLRTWFQGLSGDRGQLRQQGLKFKIKGDRRAGNPTTRSNAIKGELEALHRTLAPDIPTHPGLNDDGTPRSGNLNFDPDSASTHLDLSRSTKRKIAVNLPNASPTDPGSLVGAASNSKCPIKLTVRFTPHHGGLGLAQRGEILTVINQNHPKSSIRIVIHELGHLMNLSAHNVAADAHAPGLPKRKSVTEALTVNAYKTNGNNGHTYVGKGHSGPHCAYGLSDADKTGLAHYDNAANDAKCIMFGSASFNDAVVGLRKFCPECTEYAKARDVSRLGP